MCFVISLFSTMNVSPAKAADALNWGTYSAIDGESVTGIKRLSVRSNTSGYISRWCIFVDNAPLSGPQYQADYRSPGDYSHSVNFHFQLTGSVEAPNQTSPGCWTLPSTNGPIGLDVQVDTSDWPNGTHTFKIEATSSTFGLHSKSVVLNSTNNPLSAIWITPNNGTQTNFASLSVRLQPGGAPRIVKACLSRDGTPVALADGFYFEGDTSYGNINGGMGPNGRFGTAVGGCTLFDLYQDNDYPPGLHRVTNLVIGVNTLSWPDAPTTLTFSAQDAIGRTSTSSITVNISNSKPSASVSGLGTNSISELVDLSATVVQSGSSLSRVCATLDGSPNSAITMRDRNNNSVFYPHSSGCWSSNSDLQRFISGSAMIVITSYLLSNTQHTLTMSATDSRGRSDSTTHVFNVLNGPPQISLSGAENDSTVDRWINLAGSASLPSYIKYIFPKSQCIALDQDEICSNTQNPYSFTRQINTTCRPNGNVLLKGTVVDSVNRKESTSKRITIQNSGPSSPSSKWKNGPATWSDKTTSGTLTISGTSGCYVSVELFLRGARKAQATTYFTYSSPNTVQLKFSRLKPGTTYTAKIRHVNAVSTSAKTASFTTSAIPPRPQTSALAALCPTGSNLETCITKLRAYPLVLDCTYSRRSWIYDATRWWIIGYRSGSPVISQSRRGCA